MITGKVIRRFWESLPEETRLALRKQNPILFVGNGISRLAQSENHLPSWYEWVRRCWEDIQPPLPFEYAMLRNLSLPECITYLKESIERKPGASYREVRESKKEIYHTLWEVAEKHAQPGTLHHAIVDRFNIIVTTNYDTLLERAAKARGYATEIIVIGAKGASAEPLEFVGKEPRKLIIKLHGSFPLSWLHHFQNPTEEAFRDWYKKYEGEDLIASIRSYRSRPKQTRKIVDEVASRLQGLPVVILGYGMTPEDDLVIELLEQHIQSPAKVAMTYGGDVIDNHRFANQWGITHLSIRGDHGGGVRARIDAHLQFIDKITTGACKETEFQTNRVLLVGQASVNYVLRLESAPLQERAYRVLSGGFYPEDTSERDYELRQIGGQMLVPATFLNAWEIPVSFASVIGHDEFGLEIRRYLQKLKCVDWRYVEVDSRVTTDHSYAITFEDVRTLIDCGDSYKHRQVAKRFANRISDDLASTKLVPTVIYLSKWYLDVCALMLQEWCEKLAARPLVVYETGTRGTSDPEASEGLVGGFCDVVLSSSLFAMRIAKLPLWSPVSKTIEYRPIGDSPVAEWDKKFSDFQSMSGIRNRSYQNLVFAMGLRAIGCKELHRRLFGEVFSNASWWVVTLGNGGMLVLNRDHPGQGAWIPAPPVNVRNALGCGDVSRAGFIGWFMKSGLGRTEFLNSSQSMEAAVKYAIATGSYKLEYFGLDDAIQYLTWEFLSEKAPELSVYRLDDVKTIQLLCDALSV